jgi:hypothetical protein
LFCGLVLIAGLFLVLALPACRGGGPPAPAGGGSAAGGAGASEARGDAPDSGRDAAESGRDAAVAAERASGGPISSALNPFAASSLWDDGKAELNAYDATHRRYGILRPFTAYHIVVKEDFSRRQLVKADPGHDPADLVTVLKLNQVLDYQTGIYSYNQMASAFFERTGMDLLKFSLTSFEWCGNTYKEYTRRGGEASLHVHTYWDGQAEATYVIPVGPDVVLYDQLPLWVRSLPQLVGASRSLRLVPGQIESKGPKPGIIKATLRCAGEEMVSTPAGSFKAMRWELAPSAGVAGGAAAAGAAVDAGRDIFWTARDFPYLLVAWDKADGSTYRLKWTQRLAYWHLNHPGDEKYLLGPGAAGPGSPAGSGAATPGAARSGASAGSGASTGWGASTGSGGTTGAPSRQPADSR